MQTQMKNTTELSSFCQSLSKLMQIQLIRFICKLNIIFHSKLSNEMPTLVLAHTILSTNYKMHFTIFFSQLTNAYVCLFEKKHGFKVKVQLKVSISVVFIVFDILGTKTF